MRTSNLFDGSSFNKLLCYDDMKILLAILLIVSFGIIPAFAEDYSYSPLRIGQSPWGVLPTDDQIREDMENLSKISEKIRVYDTVELEPILKHAYRNGLLVSVEVSVSDGNTAKANIDKVAALNEKYPGTIGSVIIGSNEIFKGNLTPDELVSFVLYSKYLNVPVTSLNNHMVWETNPELVDAVDFIMVDAFIQDETDDPINAVKIIQQRYDVLKKQYAYKSIVLETGWSTNDSSKIKQMQFVSALHNTGIKHFIFMYADEDWKEYPLKSGFGILTGDRKEKPESPVENSVAEEQNVIGIVDDYIESLQNDPITQTATGVAGLSGIVLYILKFLGYLKTGSQWGEGYVG